MEVIKHDSGRFSTCLYTTPEMRSRNISHRLTTGPHRDGHRRARTVAPKSGTGRTARLRGDQAHPPGRPRAAGNRPGASRGSPWLQSRRAAPTPACRNRPPGSCMARAWRVHSRPTSRRRGAGARGARLPTQLARPGPRCGCGGFWAAARAANCRACTKRSAAARGIARAH